MRNNFAIAGSMLAGWAALGCSGQPQDNGNKALGIAAFDTAKTDSSLQITGVNADDAKVAQITVKNGLFTLTGIFADEEGSAAVVDGRVIDISFGKVTFHHESKGYGPLILPLPTSGRFVPMHAFLDDPHVQPALKSVGVQFAHTTYQLGANGEVAFSNGTFSISTGSFYTTDEGVCGGTCGGSPCGGTSWGYGTQPTQYCNSGWGTNACPGNNMMTSGTVGDCDNSSYPNQSFIAFSCYNSSSQVQGAVKACVPQANGQTQCGRGGSVGCWPCYSTGFVNIEGAAGYDGGAFSGSCSGNNSADVWQCSWGAPGASCGTSSDCCSNSCDTGNGTCN